MNETREESPGFSRGECQLLAIYHEDGTINLVKGRNIITLPRQHLEKLLSATSLSNEVPRF